MEDPEAAATVDAANAAVGEQLCAAFPHAPYAIQSAFMLGAYQALEQRQIGLFESPTGTGKTLSVICSTLKWLEDHRVRQQQEAAAAAAASDEAGGLPSWLLDAAAGAAEAAAQPPAAATTRQLAAQRASSSKRRQARPAVLDEDGNDLSEFLLDAAQQPGSSASPPGSKRGAPDSGYQSSDSEQEADAPSDPAAASSIPSSERRRPQVIFCSRTHSQLSQFVGELHRTRFADTTLLVAVGSRKALCVNDQVRQLPELSQVNERCLDLQRNKASAASSSKRSKAGSSTAAAAPGASNSSVVGLTGGGAPKRQRTKARAAAGCPFLSPEGGAAGWEDFREMVLAAPVDVEELAALGRTRKVCPYYGSRRAVPGADVILAPYSAVLMPDARSSLGIELQDSVLVFDEAHNLLDAINSAHSTAVTAWQLLSVQRSFSAYYERFKAFLNPVNAQHLQQLLHIAAALHKCLQQPQPPQQQHQQQQPGQPHHHSSTSSSSRVLAVNDLLFDLGLDNVNMFELARWVRDNKMAFKVSGYTAAAVARAGGSIDLQQPAQAAAAAAGEGQPEQQLGQLSAKDGVSAIHSFVSYLLSMTNQDSDGRIIIEAAASTSAPAAVPSGRGGSSASEQPQQRGGRLRYVVLNAARHFGSLLACARAVLLVSGTLAPVDGLTAQLFPDVAPSRIHHFECGHVVPADQLLAVSVGRGPSGRGLNLKHEGRGEVATIEELGQLLVGLAGVVPQGLVVFVPSFGYLEQLAAQWTRSGLWARLAARKQVFREPRAATDVEAVLEAYAAAISGSKPAAAPASGSPAAAAHEAASSPGGSAPAAAAAGGGALMLCVVGGKLSEGINFGDGLGRCVVVVGLPYPNITDVELQERMKYIDAQAAAAAGATTTTAQAASTAAAAATLLQPTQDVTAQHDQQQQQQAEAAAPEAPSVPRSAFRIINQAAPPAGTQGSGRSGPDKPAQQQQEAAATAAAAAASGSEAAGASAAAGPPAQVPSSSGRVLHALTGRDYYEDLAFKAVNQCVGRVVRHKGDHAAVVLLDVRWVVAPAEWAAAGERVRTGGRKLPVQKLPGWLQRSFVPTDGGFGPALKQLAAFFKRQQQPG